MPLPKDPALVELSNKIVDITRETFHTPLSYRPLHAKGQLVKGTFKPSKDAVKLSKASIFSNASTPVIVRFSSDTGLPDFPDNAESGSRGFAIRFVLSEDGHKHYDIVTNNGFGFPVSSGEEFLELFQAINGGKMDEFMRTHSHAKYFTENQAAPHAVSFATEQFHGVNAFRFVNIEGRETYFRWRITPWQGVMKYSKADTEKHGSNYHFDDLEWRLSHSKPIRYRMLAQLAGPGDPTNDATKVWPETSDFVEMGEVVIDKLWSMHEGNPAGEEQKWLIFDPMPRQIEGIEASDDPLLELRAAVYLNSGRIRREHLADDVKQAVA